MIKIGSRREHLLGRMKAGIGRFLARKRLENPAPENQPMPSVERVLEILGDPSRPTGGPSKGA